MIIENNINSPISISEEGLQIFINFNKPDVEKGRGDIRYTAYFQNVVGGVILDTKQVRVLILSFQTDSNSKFSFQDLENYFLSNYTIIVPYLVNNPFEWINK